MSRPTNRAVKSCTQCKQVKLRCDSKEKFPAPCTRCQSRGYQCVVDSSFRRMPARRRVEEMAKELEALKSQRNEDPVKGVSTSLSIPGPLSCSSEHSAEYDGIATLDENGCVHDQFQLEDLIVQADTVKEIYKIFCAAIYPHFPILHPTISISNLHDTSPLLFWTLLAITTSRPILPSHTSIAESLREPYMRLFRLEALNAPLPLQTIQAITYLSMFPFPLKSQSKDPSFLHTGLAVNAAMYMGLHRAKPAPSLRSIGVYSGSPQARAHTWLGCFLASTALAKHVGLSSPITSTTDLAVIEHLVQSHPLPPEFTYQIMTHHTLAKFFSTLVENSHEILSHSLVRIIEAELDAVLAKFPTPWTPRVEMSLLSAKLLLYTTAIVRLQDRPTREILMRSALNVAVRIAYTTSQGLTYIPASHPSVPKETWRNTLPKNYYRILVLSTSFLIRFFVLNNDATLEEQELARNHVALVQRYIVGGASGPEDERMKAAHLFDVLSRQKPIDLETSKLRVDDRMGASLVYDALTTGHELRHVATEIEEASVKGTEFVVRNANKVASTDEAVLRDALADASSINSLQPLGMGLDLDFSLPADLWGDSIWGMFEPVGGSGWTGSAFGEVHDGSLGSRYMGS